MYGRLWSMAAGIYKHDSYFQINMGSAGYTLILILVEFRMSSHPAEYMLLQLPGVPNYANRYMKVQ